MVELLLFLPCSRLFVRIIQYFALNLTNQNSIILEFGLGFGGKIYLFFLILHFQLVH